MKRLVVFAIAAALSCAAGAQLYKYVDKDGKTVYSDQPPPNATGKQLNIQSAPVPVPKSALERDKDLQKGRDESKDKGKKADEKAKLEQQAEERCNQATARYQHFADGGKIFKSERDASGERALMTDQEIETARDTARREKDEACKKA